MHNRWYYRNPNGNLDPHAKKIAWKNHDMAKVLNRKEAILNDWNLNNHYSMDVTNTLWVNTQRLSMNRRNTKLALRQSLAIVPLKEIAHELRVQDFTLVPQENTLPAPVKQSPIRFVA